MGCCNSTPRASPTSYPSTSERQAGSSSRAAIVSSAPVAAPLIPPPRAHEARHPAHLPPDPAPHEQQYVPRPVRLSEHFNTPIRRHVWASTKRRWTSSDLSRERDEFFDTRVSGQQEIWRTIRMAIECMEGGDIPMAQTILDAAGCTVPTGDLVNGVYDERGNYYQLPEYCLSDPTNLAPPSVHLVEADSNPPRRRENRRGRASIVGDANFEVGGDGDEDDESRSLPSLSSASRHSPRGDLEADGEDDSLDAMSEASARRRRRSIAKGKARATTTTISTALLQSASSPESPTIPLSQPRKPVPPQHIITARLSNRGGPDLRIKLSQNATVRTLLRRIHEAAGVRILPFDVVLFCLGTKVMPQIPTTTNRVRIAFMGRILKEGETLEEQGWKEGWVLGAWVLPKKT
ncbi:MAG: hypothetical protein M1829_002670 [Trizodia sp. TS-e1964]|nr:MAG: hypothetical protein M1829_002670 [Trizodia sp. TS-e1964]